MSPRPVVPRAQAQKDIEDAIDHYAAEAGQTIALAFVNALERAFRQIAEHPASGSPRYAHELGIAELRSWPLKRYPYVVFYSVRADAIDVWRVLHGHRDIPAWMRDGEGT